MGGVSRMTKRATTQLQRCEIQPKPTFPEDLVYDNWRKWAEVGEQLTDAGGLTKGQKDKGIICKRLQCVLTCQERGKPNWV